MADATLTIGAEMAKRGLWSELRFLTQVSRPGLWSTTAPFYLMPLGHGELGERQPNPRTPFQQQKRLSRICGANLPA